MYFIYVSFISRYLACYLMNGLLYSGPFIWLVFREHVALVITSRVIAFFVFHSGAMCV